MCMMFYGLSISHTLSVYYYYYVCYFFLVIVTLTFGGFLQIAEIGGGGICGIQTERVWVALR